MCGGYDAGEAQRAAENERKRIEAERENEKMKEEQRMLAEKQATAAAEASAQLRQRQLLGSVDDEEYDPLTGKKKPTSTLLGS